jgi:uncharacterized protein YndB with AHSA1/START domain
VLTSLNTYASRADGRFAARVTTIAVNTVRRRFRRRRPEVTTTGDLPETRDRTADPADGDDGSTCDWGTVLSWEPNSRLVLSWDITADWQYDPTLKTEIEVRFIADGKDRTRVELEHRHLDRYGTRRDEMRTIFDGTGDWGRLLEAFARAAAA